MIRIDGDETTPRDFSPSDMDALGDRVPDVSVLVPGREGSGVRLRALLQAAGARGAWLTLESSDGFSISVPRAEVEDGVLVYRLGGDALPPKKGGPVRFLLARPVACDTGGVDACANVKALAAIHVTREKGPDTHRHA